MTEYILKITSRIRLAVLIWQATRMTKKAQRKYGIR